MGVDRNLSIWFRLYQLYGYAVTVVAGGIIIQYVLENRNDIYTGQAVFVGIGTGTPVLLNGLLFVGVIPPDLNATDIGFGITAISFAVAIFRYRMLRIIPVGRQQLFDMMDDPIVLVDDGGRVVDCNQMSRRLFEIDSGWQGMEATVFFEPYAEVIQQALTADGGAHKLTIEQNRHDRYFDVNTTPTRTQSGDAGGQLIALRDISPLEQAKQELETANQKLDTFSGTVSHNLRNPLNVIKGRAELLQAEAPAEHVEPIENNVERMETIIDDLLTLSRAGESVDDSEPVLLAGIVADSWTAVRSDDSELDVDIPDDLEVKADADRLRHVFENLFRNACEHNDSPLTVRVGTRSDETGAVLGFFIPDDGAGIPELERAEVFERGYTTNVDGAGFGLPIVEEIITAHGWTISLSESEAGGARSDVHITGQS